MAELETKVCTKCKVPKPVSCFYQVYQNGRTRRRPRCIPCFKEDAAARQSSKTGTPQGIANRQRLNRARYFKDRFGLTEEEFWWYYNKFFEEQDGKCAICGTTEQPIHKSGERRFCLDHNHETGEIRGLLCKPCNVGIGQFYEDQERLLAAVAYLKTHNRG